MTPTPQDVRRKGSKILKLPPVRNCFTLAMTNKSFVIINRLKVPKIKKILLYEMKFLVLNYSCLQSPWLGGYRPQIPVLNLLNPPPEQNSWVLSRGIAPLILNLCTGRRLVVCHASAALPLWNSYILSRSLGGPPVLLSKFWEKGRKVCNINSDYFLNPTQENSKNDVRLIGLWTQIPQNNKQRGEMW